MHPNFAVSCSFWQKIKKIKNELNFYPWFFKTANAMTTLNVKINLLDS